MTPWTLPRSITQYAESGAEKEHVSWLDPLAFPIKTARDLIHIARSPKLDDTDRTWYLEFTAFDFTALPPALSGINIRILANRRGRISDDTVQLVYQGSAMGKNQAQPAQDQTIERATTLLPTTVYGGGLTVWGFDTAVDLDVISDATFGVRVRFQSHPYWPHRDSALLEAVELQIY
jgi:hypothetical protein